jgi:hypothetical protein
MAIYDLRDKCSICSKRLDAAYVNSTFRLWSSQIICKDCKREIKEKTLAVLKLQKKYLSAQQISLILAKEYSIISNSYLVKGALENLKVESLQRSHHKVYKLID